MQEDSDLEILASLAKDVTENHRIAIGRRIKDWTNEIDKANLKIQSKK